MYFISLPWQTSAHWLPMTPPVKTLLNFLEKHSSEKHTHYLTNKTLCSKNLWKSVSSCLKTETYLTAPKCLVFANDLVHTCLSSLPPPQACLELACASTCLTYHTKVHQLPLHHPLSVSVALICLTICSLRKLSFLPLLCPSLGNVPVPQWGPPLSGNTGLREQPDVTFPVVFSEIWTRTWSYH